MFEELSIGDPYLRVAGRPEGVTFDINYPYIELVYHIERPTEKELSQVGHQNAFEIRAVELNDIIIITSKAGSLMWMDAPFNPRLENFKLDEIERGTQCYGLFFFVTDAPEGIIRHMRFLGLGNEFSRKLRALAYENREKDIPQPIFDRKLQEVYANYPTEKIAEMSAIRYKIRPE